MDWTGGGLLQDKTIVVTGCASGIGRETARLVKRLGGDVIGVDLTRTTEHVDAFHRTDLSDPRALKSLVEALPAGIDGLANIAGLPPTAPAGMVIKVNLLGLRRLTETLIPKLADGASIVNLASLSGFGWADSLDAIRAAETLAFEDVDAFVHRWGVSNEGGRSYLFSKEALVVWTMKNRWTWRDRGIRMNAVSPGPVETPILKDFMASLGPRAQAHGKVMDRHGAPGDVAPVVAFLLSDMTRWIRGANIPCDGGLAAHFHDNIHHF
jgi:NAD(P)-dependent dehydrogenase (short-subunit alcohol dehydrogenase family)